MDSWHQIWRYLQHLKKNPVEYKVQRQSMPRTDDIISSADASRMRQVEV